MSILDNIINSLNGKADKDLTNCTKPYIVETYQNGTSWYRVYSDGWCEQGGHSIGNANAAFTQVLLKNFVDTNYSILLTGYQTGTTSDYNAGVVNGSKTTSNFQFYRDDYEGGGVDWQARGYIS